MALKNYTSQVPASRSINHIEDVLVGHKASQVLKLYGPDERIAAMAFMVPIDGVEIPFKLPARVVECERVLKAAVKKPTNETYRRIAAQAERTAWKIVSDWVDAQMAMVELAQVDLMEVFLPYIYDHQRKQTYFEQLKEKGFQKCLPTVAAMPTASG